MQIKPNAVDIVSSCRFAIVLVIIWALGLFLPTGSQASCHPVTYCCDGITVDNGNGSCSSVPYCACYPTSCSCSPCSCWPWQCDSCYNNPTPSCSDADDPLTLTTDPCEKNITCDDATPPGSDNGGACSGGSGQNPYQPSPQEGDPVNLFSGAETFVRTDLSLGNAHRIVIKRRYNSGSNYAGRLGYGWGLNYDQRLYTYADGSVVIRKESGWKRRFALSGSNYLSPVGESGTLVKNGDGSFTLTQKSGARENFDILGRLASLVDEAGNSLIISYESTTRAPQWGLLPENVGSDPLIVTYNYRLTRIEEKNAAGNLTGAWVDFQYDGGSGLLSTLTDSSGRVVSYDQDSYGNLTTVTGPAADAASTNSYAFNHTYDYGDSVSVHRLMAIDEGNGTFTNQYDSRNRVSSQSHAGGEILFDYLVPYQKTQITTTIKDSAGNILNTRVRTVEFDNLGQIVKETDAFGNVNNFTRNSNGWITYQDFREKIGTTLVLKNATSFTYDGQGNVLTRTDAIATPLEKTATFTYHPVFNKVATETVKSVVDASKNKVTTNTYDNFGNLRTVQVTGQLNESTTFDYTTTFTFDTTGHLTSINGPRTDVLDVATLVYDPVSGFLTSLIQPLIGTTTFSNHDPLGNPRTIIDPNSQTTLYTYDAVGRVTSIQEAGVATATRYFYVTGGCTSCGATTDKLDYILRPNNDRIDFTYDDNGNQITITDQLGNSINKSYDSEGNLLSEELKDSTGVLQKSVSMTYDALDRLKLIINPDATFSAFGYDYAGRGTSVKNPKDQSTTYQYDALGRLGISTQPGNITTTLGYTAQGDLATLTDGNNNTTTFSVDDLGRVYRAISPDTGTTYYSYDPAGNLTGKTDGKGVTTTYLYDAANRLTKVDFSADTDLLYSYDNPTTCPNSKGRLCSVTDASGTITYDYIARGLIQKETRIIGGVTLATLYANDTNNNLTKITYPSGRVITYGYSNDRVSTVSTTIGGVTTTLASAITYKPFGPMKTLTYGNGLTGTMTYDSRYRLTGIVTSNNVQSLVYGPDANANVTTITDSLDSTKSKSYGYDNRDQLTSATGSWGTLSWGYDNVGNRLNEGATSYTTTLGSNHLSSAGGTSYFYDNNGNTIAAGTRTYVYNQNQRLTQVTDGATSATYSYNGLGQRVKKVVNGVTTLYHYDLDGRLIVETDAAGITQVEYVYLNGQPLAMIRSNNIYWYHNDHLGTPQKLTNSTKAVVWSGEFKPFGQAQSLTASVVNNLRFPGQYFDAETGQHYNYFRDYNPLVGRYVQADPIGLRGGVNLYAYVQGNPINYVDPTGEIPVVPIVLGVALMIGSQSESLQNTAANSAQAWANLQAETGNPLYSIPGSLSTLADPCNARTTATVLGLGSMAGGYLGRPFWQYYPAGNPSYSSAWMTRGLGWKPPYSPGLQAAERLALPPYNPATAVRAVSPSPFRYVAGPRTVQPQPQWGQLGGGIEYRVGGF